ncbi:MAG: hypothetical protein JOZ40_21275 [Methylobacteriaceae bacterium]|nr:hypothetical protein [Methylobacteriaceae bacterium]
MADSEVIAALEAFGRRFDGLEALFERVEASLRALEMTVRSIDAGVRAVPDLNALANRAKLTLDMLQEYRDGMSMMRAGIKDFARVNVTRGEIESIHSDLRRLEAKDLDKEVRLRMVEEIVRSTPADT